MKKFILDTCIIILLTLILAEAVLRLLGYEHYQQVAYSITSEPASPLLADSDLGLRLNPGNFSVTINDSLTYFASHLENGTRKNSKDTLNEQLPELHLHGCSFTYGMGVNNEETFAFLLQEKIKSQYKIINHAVPAYGNIQGFLKTKNQIKNREKKPNTIMAFYANFHDERNAMNSSYRSQMHYGMNILNKQPKKIKQATFPFAQIKNDSLVCLKNKLDELYHPIFLRNYSALTNAFQEFKNKFKDRNVKESETTIKIFEDWNEICKKENIDFIVVSILDNEISKETTLQLRQKNIKTLDIGLDILNNNKFNNLPYDSHPNVLAHRVYAEKLLNYINPETFH